MGESAPVFRKLPYGDPFSTALPTTLPPDFRGGPEVLALPQAGIDLSCITSGPPLFETTAVSAHRHDAATVGTLANLGTHSTLPSASDGSGSKNSAHGECEIDNQSPDCPKRLKVMHTASLSEEEKTKRRREGNRAAAQRLRQRRMATVCKLEEEVRRLEEERTMYINHIYQLAASARSVIEENHQLRSCMEAMGGGAKLSACTLSGGHSPNPGAPRPGGLPGGAMPGGDLAQRMEFELVRRDLAARAARAATPPAAPYSQPLWLPPGGPGDMPGWPLGKGEGRRELAGLTM